MLSFLLLAPQCHVITAVNSISTSSKAIMFYSEFIVTKIFLTNSQYPFIVSSFVNPVLLFQASHCDIPLKLGYFGREVLQSPNLDCLKRAYSSSKSLILILLRTCSPAFSILLQAASNSWTKAVLSAMVTLIQVV